MESIYCRALIHLASLWLFRHLSHAAMRGGCARHEIGAMLARSVLDTRLDELQDRLGRAQVVTPDLISKVVGACTRLATPGCAAGAAVIERLIGSQAWTEAALALIEHELPLWRLRRLVCEDGIWLCSLSKQWNLPIWLGDNAEASHVSMPLAILAALIEARRRPDPPAARTVSSVPQCRIESGSRIESMCCDNFA
jgi:hypothetical protein